MSRCAMRLPAVDRRSPAITTPPSYTAATIVVPWGIASAGVPCGRRSGAAAARKSVNDGEPGVVAYRKTPGAADGKRRSLTGPRSLPGAVMHGHWPPFWTKDRTKSSALVSRTSSILVEDRVDVLGQFLVSLGDVRRGIGLDLVDLVGLPLRAALTTVMGRHRGTPSFVLDLTLTWRRAFGSPVGAREQRRPAAGRPTVQAASVAFVAAAAGARETHGVTTGILRDIQSAGRRRAAARRACRRACR